MIILISVLLLSLGALRGRPSVAFGDLIIPLELNPATALGDALDDEGAETVWDTNFRPLIVDPTANNVTIRQATLKNVLLLAPTPAVPLAFVTSSAFAGLWYLEDVVLYVPSCSNLEVFANMACDLQPAAWISSEGWSVTISYFAGGNVTSANVTIACEPATSSSTTPLPYNQSAFSGVPACVTLSAGSQEELHSLLSYPAVYPSSIGSVILPPSPPRRLHITLTANVSLDPDVWGAARPVITRPNTTISGVNCNRVTAVNLNGGISMISIEGGAVLRLLCLELSNLATDTLGPSMPRSLLSGAIWAVDVDIGRRSYLLVENSSLVLTKDEFKWQSFFMAQALTNSAVYGNVSTVLTSFQGSASPSQLLWIRVSSPHTQWRNAVLTSQSRVYETTVPNSFIMRYLGLSTYLTDLLMVYTCKELLTAVSNDSAAAARSASTWSSASGASPRVIVLGANISIGACWPSSEPVTVLGSSMTIMGLPDVRTTLDLAGRSDAFEISSGNTLSLRFLTLLGLDAHQGADAEDTALPPSGDTVTTPTASGLVKVMVMLWAFHFNRRRVQLQLENVSLVVPLVELQQHDNLRNGHPVIPYFSTLAVYLEASSPSATQPSNPRNFSGGAFAAANQTAPTVLAALMFDSLLLPGIRGSDVAIAAWSGIYANWSASMYEERDVSSSDKTAPNGDSRGSPGRLKIWQLTLVIMASVLAAFVFIMMGRYAFRIHVAERTAGLIHTKRRTDLERGEGGVSVSAAALPSRAGDGGSHGSTSASQLRRPLYDSFDDPAFELGLVRGKKLSPADVADILHRVNTEAAEFNIHMTEICGSGAFGVVYGGMWHGLKVAIKTMVFSETAPPLVGGQLARQQCIREAAFCCTMHHPNVVATHHYYLKSVKRQTMFDDILQQMDENSSSDDSDRGRCKTPPPMLVLAEKSTSRGCLAPPTVEAAAAAEEVRQPDRPVAGERTISGNTTAAPLIAVAPPSSAAGAAGGAVGRVIAARGSWRKNTLPRFRFSKNKTAVTDWRLYLIQEYCDGGTLRQAVDDRKMFRHSGMTRSTADVLGGCSSGDARCPGAGNASACADVLPAPYDNDNAAGGHAAKSGFMRRSDSFEGIPTRLIIAEQGPKVQICTAASEENCRSVPATAVNDGSNAALMAANHNGDRVAGGDHEETAAAVGRMDSLLPMPDEATAQPLDEDDSMPPPVITASPAERNAVHPCCLPSRAVTTNLDSTFVATTVTNATAESILLETLVNSNDAAVTSTIADPVIPISPPHGQLPSVQSAAANATPAAPAAAPVVVPKAEPPEEVLPSDLFLVIHTALGIASGVAYLHSRNIVHGDLSANNVLLMRTTLEHVPVLAKLSDFGLSMRLEQGQDHFKNVRHGTPYYQSPEVAEHGTLSLAADVYSLGVLLWELYHGPPPWREKNHKVRKQLILAELPDRLAAMTGKGSEASLQQPDRPLSSAAAAKAAAAAAAAAAAGNSQDEDLWDDPNYLLRACDVLVISPHCPAQYARVLRRCLDSDPQNRPSARAVVKALLRMERSLATAAAAAGDKSSMPGAPVGAMMALTRPVAAAFPVPGRTRDAALLLEDFDAAAAAVAAAVARVTAAPTVAGAPASAGAAAVVAAAAAAGAASGSLLPVLDSTPQLVAAAVARELAGRENQEAAALMAKAAEASSSRAGARTRTVTSTAATQLGCGGRGTHVQTLE